MADGFLGTAVLFSRLSPIIIRLSQGLSFQNFAYFSIVLTETEAVLLGHIARGNRMALTRND